MVWEGFNYDWEENPQSIVHELAVFMLSLTCLAMILYFSIPEEDRGHILLALFIMYIVMVVHLLRFYPW